MTASNGLKNKLISSWAKNKLQKKTSKVFGVPKLEDANWAGTDDSDLNAKTYQRYALKTANQEFVSVVRNPQFITYYNYQVARKLPFDRTIFTKKLLACACMAGAGRW